MQAYLRQDGSKGIRNTLLVVYLVECAHHVARGICQQFPDHDVQLIGFPGCYPNKYAQALMESLVTHSNVGAVQLISLGCEGFNRYGLEKVIADSGRPVNTLVIQENQGTAQTMLRGAEWVASTLTELDTATTVDMSVDELIIGTICGGSDGTSGITANPGIGRAFDQFVAKGATCIFEETGELIGCEGIMSARAATPAVAKELVLAVEKAAIYYDTLGHGSFAPGNADGGLTTQEEKSMGAYAKSGASNINGVIYPSEIPSEGGLYLLDVVPDGEVRFGFPNIADTAEIIELISCGSHVILFATGRGSVVGSAISPVIKVCANPQTYRNMTDDMDIDAGRIIENRGTLDEVGQEIFELVINMAEGGQSKSEKMGHREYLLTYKYFSAGRACS